MSLLMTAASLTAGPYLVNESGVPVSDERVLAWAELICQDMDLHAGFVHPVAAQIIRVAGCETYTRLNGGDVLTCAAKECSELAAFYSKGRAVCDDHIGWEPPKVECSCEFAGIERWTRGNHHQPDCHMWMHAPLSEADLSEWADGQ